MSQDILLASLNRTWEERDAVKSEEEDEAPIP